MSERAIARERYSDLLHPQSSIKPKHAEMLCDELAPQVLYKVSRKPIFLHKTNSETVHQEAMDSLANIDKHTSKIDEIAQKRIEANAALEKANQQMREKISQDLSGLTLEEYDKRVAAVKAHFENGLDQIASTHKSDLEKFSAEDARLREESDSIVDGKREDESIAEVIKYVSSRTERKPAYLVYGSRHKLAEKIKARYPSVSVHVAFNDQVA